MKRRLNSRMPDRAVTLLNDLAARLDHGFAARWGVARLGSTWTALDVKTAEGGRRPARRPRTALRPLPERRDRPAACVGPAREPVPGQAGQDAWAEQRRRV